MPASDHVRQLLARTAIMDCLAVPVGDDLLPDRGDIGGGDGAIPAISPRRILPEMAYLFDVV